MRTTITFIILVIFFASCSSDEIFEENTSNKQELSTFQEHPKAAIYQKIIDDNQKKNLVGISLMVKDKHGIYLGSSGYADMTNKIDVQPYHPFFIASITKVFTASLVYLMIEEGRFAFDDQVSELLDASAIEGLANAADSQIKHLLNHTSGIPDYYTMQYDMVRMNKYANKMTHEDILEFAKPLKANNEIGEAYRYCNTNYLLLGMIIEKATGKQLSELFDQYIFQPLDLKSGYYGGINPIPTDVVKGYIDIYGDGKYVESKFLLQDELNNADGGIAINAFDLGMFFEKLMKGELISETSLAQMNTYMELPDGWWDPAYHTLEAGYGIEMFKTPYGNAVGHTGSVMGFSTLVQYFPEHDATYILFVNCSTYKEEPKKVIYRAILEEMFEQ